MATRFDFQIALDIVKHVNIINDFLDNASYTCRDLNTQTGEPLINKSTGEPYTLAEIQGLLTQLRANINAYYTKLSVFINRVGVQRTVTALSCIGVDGVQIKTEFENMRDVIEAVIPMVQSATTKADLIPVADYIDANSVKLELVRRAWDL